MPTSRVLRVEKVHVAFDGFTVIDHLNFDLEYGELRFLIGPNGAGKTTLMDVISGKTRPLSGRVIFDEIHDVGRMPEHRLVQLGVARKFQTPSVFASLTCYQNVEVAGGFRDGVLRLLRPMRGAGRGRVHAALETVGLDARAGVLAGALSHGERQWLEIAMLLVQEPKLLLLDEPVAGMTRAERDQTGELLHRLEGSHSIVITEHDMDFVRAYARKVSVLHQGQVISEGPVEQVQADRRVVEVYLGHAAAR